MYKLINFYIFAGLYIKLFLLLLMVCFCCRSKRFSRYNPLPQRWYKVNITIAMESLIGKDKWIQGFILKKKTKITTSSIIICI